MAIDAKWKSAVNFSNQALGLIGEMNRTLFGAADGLRAALGTEAGTEEEQAAERAAVQAELYHLRHVRLAAVKAMLDSGGAAIVQYEALLDDLLGDYTPPEPEAMD